MQKSSKGSRNPSLSATKIHKKRDNYKQLVTKKVGSAILANLSNFAHSLLVVGSDITRFNGLLKSE